MPLEVSLSLYIFYQLYK